MNRLYRLLDMNRKDIAFLAWELSGLNETVSDPVEVANWADSFYKKCVEKYPELDEEIKSYSAAQEFEGKFLRR